MDLNTNLRDDKFLFADELKTDDVSDKSSMHHMVENLNKKGINTVGDLIYCDQTQFSPSVLHFYRTLIQILRYKYLGEDIVNDVLLESNYTSSSDDQKKLAMDLRRLGFGKDLLDCKKAAKRFALVNKFSDSFTMEQCLKNKSIGIRVLCNLDIRSFYLEYIIEKRKKEEQEKVRSPKDVLETLKNQLESLELIRTSLDEQILELKNQINTLSGGQTRGK